MFNETRNGLIIIGLLFIIVVIGALTLTENSEEDPLVDIYCMDLKTTQFEWKYLPNLHHQGGDFYLEYTQRGEVLKYRCDEPTEYRE